MAKCDGVTLHSAHGYVISEFLSPDMNARTDEYGGSLDNRVRFAVEVIEGIRKACGPDFIIGARIPGHEWVSDGLTDDECDEIARRYEAAGCDYLDISGGATDVFTKLMETERYEQGDRVSFAARIKKAVSIPVGAVGALREPEFCDKLIKEGTVDFLSLGRTLICDPYWPEKAASGRANEIRPCLSYFDGCTNRLFDSCAISCALNPVAGRELEIGNLQKTDTPKNVVVIGGGAGGMQAAITAARIGHTVTLLEKSDKLGGQFNIACVPPYKEKIAAARDWFAGELARQGVTVKLNWDAGLNVIKSLKPDAVIAATGAVPVTEIPVPGVNNTVQGWDLLNGKVAVPGNSRVTIIGGGIVGCEIAEMLLEKGNSVSIIEMLPEIANGLEMIHKLDLLQDFAEKKVNVKTNSRVTKISQDSVSFIL
ncbi:MAG: FAD-dependent oxidoreductase [Treponema sp.]|nr:FAD-dependent oxidoreductase [Treponema sp.]